MAKKPTKEQREESKRLQGYLDAIAKYERTFKPWEQRVEKILKRYRDDGRETRDASEVRFNILWSNVQILVPATFARLPQPDVSRRFRDQDPTGRVAALMLERGLEFEVQHYPDYRDTMQQCVHDRFLGGRGTAWLRYEPHFKDGETGEEQEGQITEDIEGAEPQEALDYECAPVDYVHWRDFGHSVARTWEEVTLVWRWVFMSEEAVKERFPEKKFPKLYKEGKCIIPFDATPEDSKGTKTAESDVRQQAKICELWDKELGVAVWFSKSMKEMLDERDDPLKLQQFFPCPKPLFATLTNEKLIPVPDFSLYQDQANTLDILADRASGLAEMMQVKGVFDGGADAALGRLFTEGNNGKLMPVKNWAAFAEKNGLKGQVDVYDLTPIVKALEAVYGAAEQEKQKVYEIMGISDIVRGSSDPNETLGAQELKGQYASMRLRAMQADVARFATDILQLKAQIMCAKFNPQTLIAISAAEQLSEADKQFAFQYQPGPIDPQTGKPGPAQPVMGPDGKPMPGKSVALLIGPERMQDPAAEAPNALRSFRIEVASDSMIQMDEAAEKRDRMEFLQANGVFMEKATQMLAQAGPTAPILVGPIMELWKYGITAFKVGKNIEGTLDEAADRLKEFAKNPPPPAPDPAVQKAQADLEMEKVKAQREQQMEQEALQREQMEKQAQAFEKQQQDAADLQREQIAAQEKAALDANAKQLEHANKCKELDKQDEFNRWKAELEADTKIIVAEIAASSKPEPGEGGEGATSEAKPKRESPLKVIAQAQADFMEKVRVQGEALAQAHQQMADSVSQHMERQAQDAQAPVVGRRGPDGRIGMVQRGGRVARVVRGPDGISIVPEVLQ